MARGIIRLLHRDFSVLASADAALQLMSNAIYLITALLYAGLAVGVVMRFNAARGGPDQPHFGWLTVPVAIALTLHGALLAQSMLAGGGVNLSIANTASLVAWLALALYWVASLLVPRLSALQAVMLPFCAVAVVLPLILHTPHLVPYAGKPWFAAHFGISMLAYSLFIVAIMHALLMTIAEASLHKGEESVVTRVLPPLLEMERVLFRVLAGAFLFLTLTVITGVFFSELLFDKPFRFNHKTVFAVIAWVVFAVLLIGRYRYGLRGRPALKWVIAGFSLLLLSYFGYKFVLEVILQRA